MTIIYTYRQINFACLPTSNFAQTSLGQTILMSYQHLSIKRQDRTDATSQAQPYLYDSGFDSQAFFDVYHILQLSHQMMM